MNSRMTMLLPVVLLILISCGGGYLAYTAAEKSLQAAVLDHMSDEAEGLARTIGAMARNVTADITRVAALDEARNFFKHTNPDAEDGYLLSSALKAIKKTYPNFEVLAVMNTQGVAIASSHASFLGRDFSARNYFLASMTGKTFLAPPFKSSVMGKAIIVASAPIILDDAIVGVVSGIIALDELYKETVAPVTLGQRGFAYVLSPDGLIAMHHKTEHVLNPSLNSARLFKKIASEMKHGALERTNSAGIHVFNAYARDELSGLTAVLQIEQDDMLAGLSELRNIIAVCAALTTVLALFLMMRLPVLGYKE